MLHLANGMLTREHECRLIGPQRTEISEQTELGGKSSDVVVEDIEIGDLSRERWMQKTVWHRAEVHVGKC